ncbi:UNVERIFIED_CONTAM: (S)-N-methylcoclaurine 3'-hydroxylase isozyme 1 [Sesamum radiatum]|uniref:(S)-N-methylcoclaurine 3'-hydroxylase isozyme 1 n=1 Tax=Sesamum radiatum TaxID=300843 RepID=A0AAW2TEB7_SESRA
MTVALLLILLPLLFLVLTKHFKLGALSSNLPPGPNPWQLLRTISQSRNKPHVAFQTLARTHGPLFSLRLGSQLIVVASSPPIAMQILKTHDKIFSGRYLPWCFQVVEMVQSSLTMSRHCNDTWKFLRGIGHNFIFSARAVGAKEELRKEVVAEMMEYLVEKDGEAVKLDDIVNVTVSNVVANVLASRSLFDVRGEGENEEKLKGLVREIVESATNLGLADLFPVLRRVDFWSRRNGMKIREKIMCVWADILEERRRCGANDVSCRDFLDVLLGNGFLDDQISIILMELLIAGTDSTIITIVWLMAELIKNQQIFLRLREEIGQAIKQNSTSLDESILSKCEYFQACIKETLRLHIPGPFLVPHQALKNCKMNNYLIPKDSIILVNAWAIHLDPNNWNNAASFKPDRFLDSKIDFLGSCFEFIPFSSGRRMCPGFHMGFRNILLVVASLVYYFDWSLPRGQWPEDLDMTDKFGTTLMREKPLYLVPRLREQFHVV